MLTIKRNSTVKSVMATPFFVLNFMRAYSNYRQHKTDQTKQNPMKLLISFSDSFCYALPGEVKKENPADSIVEKRLPLDFGILVYILKVLYNKNPKFSVSYR